MKVYLDYTQEELNSQYDQKTLVSDPSPYLVAWTEQTQTAKSTLICLEDISYGDYPDEFLDLYMPHAEANNDKPVPLLIFCHGGAWRSLSKNDAGYLAIGYVPEGIAVSALNFSLAPGVKLEQIVAQVRKAVSYLYHESKQLMLDPEQFYVIGHSSGAHLAANIAVTDWTEFGAPRELIKGLTAVSGPYDLVPVRLSARNDYLFLDEIDARELSPQTHLSSGLPPAIIAWGGRELDEFQRQGASFADAWENHGMSVQRLYLADKNHFEMGCEHMNVESSLFSSTLAQIKGA